MRKSAVTEVPMHVRAKMRCVEIKQMVGYGGPDSVIDVVVLQPVSGEANKTWSKYTPCGRAELQIDNPEATRQFKVGGFYFVDFTPAPQDEAGEKK